MKTALITGASRGIGKATADALRAQGWEVIAPTRDDMDLTHEHGAFNWCYSNEPFQINALIYCAGEWFSKKPEKQYSENFLKQYILSVTSMHVLLGRFISSLAGGVVVACASTRGFIGGVETAPYSCAKAAQIALMQGYAREYQGTRFNVVAPGWTDTDLGKLVKATGGVSNPNAVPQPAQAVADAILRLVNGDENGKVLRVVDSLVTEARWVWE